MRHKLTGKIERRLDEHVPVSGPGQAAALRGRRPLMAATEDQVESIVFNANDGSQVQAPPLNEGVLTILLDLHAGIIVACPST